MTAIDLNSDLGEGYGGWTMGNDEALLDIVTSANVACGFHAGDPVIMRRVCEHAAAVGVTVGAHVSYRDLAGFGRRFLDVDEYTLQQEVIFQIAALDGIARVAGTSVSYVKPHGALYNTIGEHEAQAAAVVAAVREYDASLTVMGLADAVWIRLARQAGLRTVREAFADRAYTSEGRLVSRREPGSVLHDATEIAQRCVTMATGEPVADVNGDPMTLAADSICVHGDTPGAVEIAAVSERP